MGTIDGDIDSIHGLLDRLRSTDVADLMPRLRPNAATRVVDGSLAASELILSAIWLGVSPIEIWRDPRIESPSVLPS